MNSFLISFVSLLFGLPRLSYSVTVATDQAFVTDYLRKYGYIAGLSPRSAGQVTLDTAIRKFQNFAGLPETGALDDATLAKMKQARCGVKDIPAVAVGRRKRQILDFGKWPENHLTYRIVGRPARLQAEVTDNEIRRAFSMWSNVANVTLRQVPDEFPADMEIAFVRGDHGDHEPFDGPKGMLGHAFFPPFGGNTHFDDAEHWTAGSPEGVNLFQVATHEFGHALGLGHSRNPRALMAPFYQPFNRNFSLQKEDIRQIQKLYGQRITFQADDHAVAENPFQTIESSTSPGVEDVARADDIPPNINVNTSAEFKPLSATTIGPIDALDVRAENQTAPSFRPQTRFYPGNGFNFGPNYGFTPQYGNNFGNNFGNNYGMGFGNHYGNGFGNNYGHGFGSNYGHGFGNNYGNGFGNNYGNNYGSSYGPTYQTPSYSNAQVPLYPVYPPTYYYPTTTTPAPTTQPPPPTYYYPPYNPYTAFTSFPYSPFPAYPTFPAYPGPFAPGYPNIIVGTPTTTAVPTTPAPVIIVVGRPNNYGNNYMGYGGGVNYGFNGYRQGTGVVTTLASPNVAVAQGFLPGSVLLRGSTTLAANIMVEDPNGDRAATVPSVDRIGTRGGDDDGLQPKLETSISRQNDLESPSEAGNEVHVNSRADLCNIETPDAVVATGSGSFIVFKGPTFWTLDKDFTADEPRSLSILAPSLTQVDATYLKPPYIFLFSGTEYYKFLINGNEMSRLPDYPKSISQGYPGLPDSPVDEVVRRGTQLWFFRGANVTVYNPEKFPPIDAATGFLDVSELEGFPERVTAAVVDDNDPKGSFIFTKGIAYKLSPSTERLRLRRRHFPRTFREWLRCTILKN